MQCIETAATVVLTLLDLSPLPLSNARPTGVCKDCAANLSEGVQHAIALNSRPAFTHTLRSVLCQTGNIAKLTV